MASLLQYLPYRTVLGALGSELKSVSVTSDSRNFLASRGDFIVDLHHSLRNGRFERPGGSRACILLILALPPFTVQFAHHRMRLLLLVAVEISRQCRLFSRCLEQIQAFLGGELQLQRVRSSSARIFSNSRSARRPSDFAHINRQKRGGEEQAKRRPIPQQQQADPSLTASRKPQGLLRHDQGFL